ncbi:MAG: hypothetical protein MZU97_20600 [Bacillus subtilis]|nr:hypothetical protein [Bacillus subtilis]
MMVTESYVGHKSPPPFMAGFAEVEIDPQTGEIDRQALRQCRRLRHDDQPDARPRPSRRRDRPGHGHDALRRRLALPNPANS